MRHWFLTNTTYGTWLPGGPRGSVTSVRDRRPDDAPSVVRFEHDLPGEPYEDPMPGLERAALQQMKGPPVYLDLPKAERLLKQFEETAEYRGWTLLAISIMTNHFHLVVAVQDDPHPRKILADFKAYGTRILNRTFGRTPSDEWWTNNGSKRKLKNPDHLAAAVRYVLYKQPNPLVVWSKDLGRIV